MDDPEQEPGGNNGGSEKVADPTPNNDHHVGLPEKNQEGEGEQTIGSPSSINPEDILPVGEEVSVAAVVLCSEVV